MLGMRGIISDRNLKFLVLVNGRNMNDPVHGGAYTEITNWDLNDIERVEVINGPGSVTYGPGAIAGVINITTKTAREAQRPEGVLKYTSAYDSYLGALSYGLQRENFDLFAYFSMVGTEGQQDPRTYNMEGTLANGYGYIGTKDFVAGSPSHFTQSVLRRLRGPTAIQGAAGHDFFQGTAGLGEIHHLRRQHGPAGGHDPFSARAGCHWHRV